MTYEDSMREKIMLLLVYFGLRQINKYRIKIECIKEQNMQFCFECNQLVNCANDEIQI